MKNCGTCRFWRRITLFGGAPAEAGDCLAIVDESSLDGPFARAKLAEVCNTYEEGSWIRTKPEFGCVLHEENPPA